MALKPHARLALRMNIHMPMYKGDEKGPSNGGSDISPGPFLNPAATPYNASGSSALVNIVPIPGPSTALMIGLGLICFLSRARAFGEIEWDEIYVALPDLRNGGPGFERAQS